MECDCNMSAGDRCSFCDAGLARLRDDIAITQCIELLTRATLDVETGERQFPGTYAHMTVEDCDQVAAILERVRTYLAQDALSRTRGEA